MRLIRLTTTSPKAEFRNSFKSDIKISPYSKIALKSLSIDTTISDITIDSANDLVDFQISGAQGTLQAQLDHGEYTSITYPSLFKDLNKKMNDELEPQTQGSNVGLEIQNKIASAGVFECKMLRGSLSEHVAHQVRDGGAVAVQRVSANGGTYKSSGTPTGNNSFIYYNKINARGGGVFRFKNSKLSTGTNNYYMGFTKTNPDTFTGTTWQNANIDYAIQVGDLSTELNYKTWVNGAEKTALASVPVTTGLTVGDANNDVVVLEINKGNIEGRIYRASQGTPDLIMQETYEYPDNNEGLGQDLYAFIIFNGDDTQTQVRNLRTTLSAFQVDPTGEGGEDLSEGLGNAPPTQPTVPTNHFLEYEGQSLANFLGFNNTRIPQTSFIASAGRFTATADSQFRPNNKSDCFIVQLLNIGVSSYDGYSPEGQGDGERKSYLAVIPQSNESGAVIYNEAYPIFVDLDNAEPLTIRNIDCRVLLNDQSPVQMLGLGTITLLIEDGEKREISNF